MTGELIKEVKHIQQCLVNKDMEGEEWEEKMEMVRKLEDVVTYLKGGNTASEGLLKVSFGRSYKTGLPGNVCIYNNISRSPVRAHIRPLPTGPRPRREDTARYW